MFNNQNRSSLFGQQSSTFGTTSTNLFGSTTAKPSAFGTTTPSAGGGLFGASTTTGTTSLFGQSTPQTSAFGATAATGGLFGSTPVKTSLFGASTTTTGGGLFGSTAAATTGGGMFGSSTSTPAVTTGGGLFGSTAAQISGTTTKFAPMISTDTMMKNGSQQSIQTKHQCITTMNEYKTKSLEELRVEDYMANRKTVTAGTSTSAFGATTGGGLFGSTPAVTTGGGLFGAAQPATTALTFGSAPTAAPAGGLFGASTTTAAKPLFGATTGGGMFGSTAPAATTGGGLFGSTATTTPATGGLFGASTATAPVFGATAAAPTTSLFGASTAGSLFGAKPAVAGSLFGAPAVTTAAPAFSFGGAQPLAAPTGGLFGAKPAAAGLFGAAQPTAATGGLFGAPAAAKPAFSFGGPTTAPAATAAAPFSFGAAVAPAAVAVVAQPQAPIVIGTDTASQQAAQTLLHAQLQGLSNSPYSDKLGKLLNSADKAAQIDATDPRVHQAHLANRSLHSSPVTTIGARPFMPGRMAPPTHKLVRSPVIANVNNTSLLDELLDDSALITGAHAQKRNIKKLVIRPRRHTTVIAPNASMTSPTSPLAERSNVSMLHQGERLPSSDLSLISDVGARKTTSDSTFNQSFNTTANQSIIGVGAAVSSEECVNLSQSDYYTFPSNAQLVDMCAADGAVTIDEGLTVGRTGYGSVFWPGPVHLSDVAELESIVIFRHKEVTVYPDERSKPAQGSGLNRPAEISLERVFPTDKSTRQPITDGARLASMKFGDLLQRKTAKMGASFKDYRPDTGTWVFEVKHFSKYGLGSDDEEDGGGGAELIKLSTYKRIVREERTQHGVQRTPIVNADERSEPMDASADDVANLSKDTRQLIESMTAVEDNLVDFQSTKYFDDEDMVTEMDTKTLLHQLHERSVRLRQAHLETEEGDDVREEETPSTERQPLRTKIDLPSIDSVVPHVGSAHKANRDIRPIAVKQDINASNVRSLIDIARQSSSIDGELHMAMTPVDAPTFREYEQLAKASAKQIPSSESIVWHLCAALWGDLNYKSTAVSAHDTWLRRRTAIIDCLSSFETEASPSPPWAHVLHLMLVGRQTDAAEYALDTINAARTSMLIGQTHCSSAFNTLMEAQIEAWRINGTEEAMCSEESAIYALCSASLPADALVGRSWTCQLLAVMLYLRPAGESLGEILDAFDQTFGAKDDQMVYQLLRLFAHGCDAEEAINLVVNAANSQSKVHIAWHLVHLLATSGVCRPSIDLLTRTSVAYSSLLLEHDLLDEAVFVARHIVDETILADKLTSMFCRVCHSHIDYMTEGALNSAAVGSIVAQLFTLASSNDMLSTLVYDALAMHASHKRALGMTVVMALKGGQYNLAHDTFVNALAPRLVVINDCDEIGGLITMMHEHREEMDGWSTGGQVLFDYVGVSTVLNDRSTVDALEGDAAKTAVIKNRLNNLLDKLPKLYGGNVKNVEFKCVYDVMSRTLWHWLRSVFSVEELVTMSDRIAVLPVNAADVVDLLVDEATKWRTGASQTIGGVYDEEQPTRIVVPRQPRR